MKTIQWVCWLVIAAMAVVGCEMSTQLSPTTLHEFKPKIVVKKDFAITDLGGYAKNSTFFSLGFSGDHYFRLTPVVVGSNVIVSSDTGKLTAIDTKTGKIKWKNRSKRPYSSGLVAADGMVLVGTNDGYCLAFDPSTGRLLWKTQLDSSVLTPPTLFHGQVLVRTENDTLYRLSLKTGAMVWQYHEDPASISLHASSSPVGLGAYVLAGLSKGQLVVLSINDGTLLARHQLFIAHGNTPVKRLTDIVATPLLAYPIVYLASAHGGILAYDIKNSQVVWRAAQNTSHNIVADDHALYMVTLDSTIVALNKETGAVLWKQKGMQHRKLTGLAMMGSDLVVADGYGGAMWLSSKNGGFLAHIQPAASSISVSPVIHHQSVYFYSLWGALAKYSVK